MNSSKKIIILIGMTALVIIALTVILFLYVPTIRKEVEYNQNIDNVVLFIYEFGIDDCVLIEGEEAKKVFKILEKQNYDRNLCNGINKYVIKTNTNLIYYLKDDCNGIAKDGKQAYISTEELNIIDNIIINKKMEEYK